MAEVKELLKNAVVNTKFVEEEFVIDVKLVNNDKEYRMIIDSRCTLDSPSSLT